MAGSPAKRKCRDGVHAIGTPATREKYRDNPSDLCYNPNQRSRQPSSSLESPLGMEAGLRESGDTANTMKPAQLKTFQSITSLLCVASAVALLAGCNFHPHFHFWHRGLKKAVAEPLHIA